MSYTRFSDEEIYRANTVDLPLFLIQRGETLEKTGSIYKFIYKDSSGTHDSITMKDNHWYDHKNQRGGYPVKFMQEYFGISYRDAVKELLGGHVSSAGFAAPKPAEQVEIKKEFKLPEPNSDMRRVFAYLTKQRFISSKILSAFAHEHTIYEEKAHHNVVFVGLGENGVPRQAHQRSTTSFGNTFRMTVAGSDTRYSFAHFGSSRRLFVFEAPIDMLSFITLYPNNWENQSFLAMNGVYESAVLKALETHDNLTDIYLCTDNDIGGIEAADRLRDILTDKGYTNILRITPTNKDFNEDLKSMNGIEPLPAVPHRRKEIVSECISELKFEPFDITRCGTTLTALVNNKKYFAAADIAMRTAAIIVMRDIKEPPNEIFERLKVKLGSGYRSYTDKGNANTRYNDMKKATTDMCGRLKNFPATAEQRSETVTALIGLADTAVRCEAEARLTNEQKLPEQDEQPRVRMSQ